MLGYCNECEQLKAIVPLKTWLREGQRNYGPVEHSEPDRHAGCGGIVHDVSCVEAGDERPIWACERCECQVAEEDRTPGGPHCNGSMQAIRNVKSALPKLEPPN